MGSGEVGGGGSVRWTFVHHKTDGTGDPNNLDHSPGGGEPGNDKVKVNNKRAIGKDSIDFSLIGAPRPGAQDLVPGYFKVSLCYASANEATAALGNAWVAGSCVVLHVPAVDRSGPGPFRPKEIVIEW